MKQQSPQPHRLAAEPARGPGFLMNAALTTGLALGLIAGLLLESPAICVILGVALGLLVGTMLELNA